LRCDNIVLLVCHLRNPTWAARERSSGWKAVDMTNAKRSREAAAQSKNIKRIGAVISLNIVCKIQGPACCFTSI
jgi:hypothetical protein